MLLNLPCNTWTSASTTTASVFRAQERAGANEGGGKAIVFNTITISDGISMGIEGMKYSVARRRGTAIKVLMQPTTGL